LVHFLPVHNVELIAGTHDDRPPFNLSICVDASFGSGLGDIKALLVDDYGLIVAELTKSRLIWVRYRRLQSDRN
jgi:hypothetical protein